MALPRETRSRQVKEERSGYSWHATKRGAALLGHGVRFNPRLSGVAGLRLAPRSPGRSAPTLLKGPLAGPAVLSYLHRGKRHHGTSLQAFCQWLANAFCLLARLQFSKTAI